MIIVDINTFFGPKAGGIRTFMLEKFEWFEKHPEHTLVVIYPGPSFAITRKGSNIILAQVYGYPLTQDPEGYRFLLDLRRVWVLLKRFKPDIVECGEPWLTGWFMRTLSGLKLVQMPIAQFYHSDPVRTYFEPWAQKKGPWAKALIKYIAAPFFYKSQKQYHLTLTASMAMKEHLQNKGIEAVAYTPFGVGEAFDKNFRVRQNKSEIHLLYGGRLDADKGMDVLKSSIDAILKLPQVHLTVMGRGAEAEFFKNYSHTRYRFVGYISNRAGVLKEFDAHDIFLAPGPFETFGMSVLEAMSLGLPVVGPNSGGVGELLQQVEHPFIFKAHSSDDFINQVKKAAESNLEQSSKEHRAVAQKYGTWRIAFDRMMKEYHSLRRKK